MDELEQMQEAVEYLLSRTSLARRVPEEVRQEIHAILRKPPAERSAVAQVWKDLRLKERFGVGEHTFRAYARQFRTMDGDAVRGQMASDIAELLMVPVQDQEQMRQAGQVLLLARVGRVLREEEVSPAQLAKLAEALSKGQDVVAKMVELKLAKKEAARADREEERRLHPHVETQEELNERVRRIYGLDYAKCTRQDPPMTAAEIEKMMRETGETATAATADTLSG